MKKKLALTLLSLVISATAFAGGTDIGNSDDGARNANIWCMVPDSFNGDFAANLYVNQDGTGEAWVINMTTGGHAAKAQLFDIKKSSNILSSNGMIGKIRNLKAASFVANQVKFDLDLTVSIPEGPTVGAPELVKITLKCGANEGVLEGLE